MRKGLGLVVIGALVAGLALALPGNGARAADTVPPAVMLPGTQPGEVSGIESVSKCDNCHGNFEPAGEPWFNWAGSMMAHASRDPLFWATVAVAEQDFDGAGDFCIRCHAPEGWLDGRSTPTEGSGLAEGDADGVQCDVCHRLVNPDGSEHPGEQTAPFLAHDGGSPPTGFYGSGMAVLSDAADKLGPYADAEARHQAAASQFHRSSALCGTCHDVSNPVTGDLAPGNGAQSPLPPGAFSDDPASPVQDKAAFKNPPYAYGVVERTFSEHQASAWPATRVSAYPQLPADLRAGAVQLAYQAAQLAGNDGDYADGAPRYFSCQSCHMRPTVGQGCNKNPPLRADLPVHDMTGGNLWVPQAILYLDGLDQLVLGGGLTAAQQGALTAATIRAQQTLDSAAGLTVNGNTARVVNRTGHKLITGYPEGRRMWLRVLWYDAGGALLAEDGAYGAITADVEGVPTPVETLLDLHPPYTRIYEVHAGITQPWAAELVALGLPAGLPLGFDRQTGAVTRTLGQLAAAAPSEAEPTFHFVLNDAVLSDTRIPPWGMAYDAAAQRNTLPVPADQYGGPGPGGTFEYWDEVPLNPPPGAHHADLRLEYQTTSWEYVQFLERANTGQVAHLADEGENLRQAWLATGMAEPYTMAMASWSPSMSPCSDGLDNDRDGAIDHPDDPGCTSAEDDSENEPGLPCDDRVDNDGDGWIDYPADPGCRAPHGALENPQCDDGIDNDNDGRIDWDGGDGGGVPDPQCNTGWKNREKAGTCGLGFEAAPLLAAAIALRARRRRAAAALR